MNSGSGTVTGHSRFWPNGKRRPESKNAETDARKRDHAVFFVRPVFCVPASCSLEDCRSKAVLRREAPHTLLLRQSSESNLRLHFTGTVNSCTETHDAFLCPSITMQTDPRSREEMGNAKRKSFAFVFLRAFATPRFILFDRVD